MINSDSSPCTAYEAGSFCGELDTHRFMNGWFCSWHQPDQKGGSLMALPKWLQQRIGTPTRQRGLKPTKCIVCHQSILVGMSEDDMAHRALVDPKPLSQLGEMLALMEGRITYQVGKYDQGLALWQRTALNIEKRKAGPEVIVFTDHRCNGPNFPVVQIPLLPEPEKLAITDEPPF